MNSDWGFTVTSLTSCIIQAPTAISGLQTLTTSQTPGPSSSTFNYIFELHSSLLECFLEKNAFLSVSIPVVGVGHIDISGGELQDLSGGAHPAVGVGLDLQQLRGQAVVGILRGWGNVQLQLGCGVQSRVMSMTDEHSYIEMPSVLTEETRCSLKTQLTKPKTTGLHLMCARVQFPCDFTFTIYS